MFCSTKPEAVKGREDAEIILVLKYGTLTAAYDYWLANRKPIEWTVDAWSYAEADAMVMCYYSRWC